MHLLELGESIKEKQFLAIILLPFLVLGFQNCGQVSVTDMGLVKSTELGQPDDDPVAPPLADPNPNNPSGPTSPGNPGYELVKQNCEMAKATNRLKEKTIEIRFPNPGRVCDWGANGNLEKENDRIRARREVYKELELNQGAKVCHVEMKNNDNQNFWYDDNIFLTLNGFILASTSNFNKHLESQDNLYMYNWSRLKNKDGQVNSDDSTLNKQYCAGTDSTTTIVGIRSFCSFPITEKTGNVHLSFPDSTIQRILGLSTAENVRLGFITTGDDNDTDCQHVDLNFEVKIQYFEDVYVPAGM